MGRHMGQEIHQHRLILSTLLQGNDVVVELDQCDDFALALLEMYLQMEYPDAAILKKTPGKKYDTVDKEIRINFPNKEDALHFVLSH